MNHSIIRYTLVSVLQFAGFFLLLPYFVGLLYGEKERYAFLLIAAACLLIGFAGRLFKPKSKVFYAREGFVTVSLSWVVLSLIGAVPFVLTGEIPSYVDAVFETASGFTTTGATILTDVEALAHCTQFFRLSTHWVGGMGVLVFILSIVPLSGSYNMHLVRAESPGPSVGKLVPRVKNTARILYIIYIAITVTEIICLLFAGMPLFDSVTMTFSTVGTGGYAILNTGTATYSRAVQAIILIFMFLCGINFSMYYLLIAKKPGDVLKNTELRAYVGIVVGASLLIAINVRDYFLSFGEALFQSAFHVVSVITTTGLASCDYNLWPSFSKTILFLLMIVGASAGSTGGGFKVSRLVVLMKSAKNEIQKVIHPRSIKKMHMDGRAFPEDLIRSILVYTGIYVLLSFVSILIVSLDNFSFETNVSAVMATLNNIGPGFDRVGPTGNFSAFSDVSKVVMIFDMLAGRLELIPILVLFSPQTWKK